MGELLTRMWYSKDYGGEYYRVAVLFNLIHSAAIHTARLPLGFLDEVAK